MAGHRIFRLPFAAVYPEYVKKAERKNRTKAEVDQIITWLTGYDQKGLQQVLDQQTNIEHFITQAPALNAKRALIKGVVCGVRVENVEDPLMKELRYLDLLIDELARGKVMSKILREAA
jgi:hypothetical protein